MKVRVTLITENDKHMPLKTKEEQTAACRVGWEMICNLLNDMSPEEKAMVESIEVIEN